MSDVVMTTGEITQAVAALMRTGARAIPNVKAAYVLMKARRKLASAAQDFEATRVALCERHAKKDADGVAIKTTVQNDLGQDVEGFDVADPAAFTKDYTDLLAISVTLEGVRAVTIDELQGASFTQDELAQLGPLVIE